VNFSILHKEDDLKFNICACCSWDRALNVGIGASFNNM
jgi:hypothetical protein